MGGKKCMYVPKFLFSDPILSTLFSSTCKSSGRQNLKSAIWFWVRQRTNFCQHFFLPPVKAVEDRISNPRYGFGCGRGQIFGTTFQEPSSLQWAEAQILKSLFSFRTTSSRGYAFGAYLLYPTPIQAPIFGPER